MLRGLFSQEAIDEKSPASANKSEVELTGNISSVFK